MKTKAKNVRPGEWLHILGAARFVLQSSKSGDNQEFDRVAAGFVSRNEMRDALERAHLVEPLSQLGITAVQETPGNSVRLLNSLTRHQFALFEKIKAALPTASVEAQLFSAEDDEDETIKTISVVLDMHGIELSVWVVLE